MKIIAMVPIKLNSQRVPHKNILPLNGHPLCWHICRSLLDADHIDRVCVYCSDNAVSEYLPKGTEVILRPKRLDEDNVKGFEIYTEFIKQEDADIYVLAHTTSPFLKANTINNALEKVISGKYDSAFSVKKIQTFAWYNNAPLNYDLNDVPRTQDIEPLYVETSGFYIFTKEIFTKHHRRIGFNPFLQEIGEIEAVDIDTPEDYNFAQLIAETVSKEEQNDGCVE